MGNKKAKGKGSKKNKVAKNNATINNEKVALIDTEKENTKITINSFNKKNWVSGQTIYSDDMNRIESGIEYLNNEVARMAESDHTHPEYFTVKDAELMGEVVRVLVENAAEEEGRVDNIQDELLALEASKVTKVEGLGLSQENYTSEEKHKLGGIEDGANMYIHPATHSASMITGLHSVATSGNYSELNGIPTHLPADGGNADTVDNRHVDDTKIDTKNLWTSRKVSDELAEKVNLSQLGTEAGQIPVLGEDSKLPKSVLPAISINETFVATSQENALSISCEIGDIVILESDTTKTYICVDDTKTAFDEKFKLLQSGTDTMARGEIESELATKVDKISGKSLSTNDFTNEFKTKLLGIENNANNYSHPTGDGNLHVPANGSGNTGKHLMATATPGVYQWNTVRFADLPDKPTHLPANGGNADTVNEKRVDDGTISQSTLWTSQQINNQLNTKVDKIEGKGLSANDFNNVYKAKLDSVAEGANKYIHPSTHPATMIVEDENHRFVSDAEIIYWNDKVEVTHLEEEIANIRYKSNIPSTVTVGGIEKGFIAPKGIDVKELLFKLLHQYVPPVVNLTSTLTQGVYELGSNHENINFNVTTRAESDRITSLKLYKDNAVIKSEQYDYNAESPSFTYQEANLNSTAVYKAEVGDGKQVISTSLSYRFVHPIYIGAVPADTLTEGKIKQTTKRVVLPSNQTFTYTLNNQRMAIAVPSGWNISSIIDPNNFNITSSFTVSNMNITCLDGSIQPYKVYTSQPTTQTNFTVKFNI